METVPAGNGEKWMRRRKFVLFGVATLLVAGVAILLPWGYQTYQAASRSSLETSAVGAMRTYAEAQTIYHRTDWDEDGKFVFADSLDKLAALGLIEKGFAEARGPQGKPWHGYRFLECQTIGGQPIDWATDYALCAIPAEYGKTGYRSFLICTNGTIFPKDQGETGRLVSDYPADILGAGWWSHEGCCEPE